MDKMIFISFLICILFISSIFVLVDFCQDNLPRQAAYAESEYFHKTNLWDISSLKEYIKNKMVWHSENHNNISYD